MENREFKDLVEAIGDIKLQKGYDDIALLLQDKLDQISTKRDDLQSEHTDLIATAFAAAQLEYPEYIGPNRDGFFLKSTFTDIPALRRALFPVLAKQGLSFRQFTRRDGTGALTLYSVLSHISGQYFSSRDTITPESATLRSYGTASKYIRRQQMMALLQCDPFDDAEDDNGESQNKEKMDHPESQGMMKEVDLKKHSYLTVSPDQIDQLEMELDGWPDLAKQFFKAYEITRVSDMRRSQFPEAFKKLLEIKAGMKVRNGI